MSFTVTRLTNGRALVKGTDVFNVEGQTIVSTEEWDEIAASKSHERAAEDFDAAVEAFFAPLLQAAEAVGKAVDTNVDEVEFVVVQEKVESVAGQPEILHRLSHDSVVLRLIESGDTGRLVWVNDELEVLATLPAPDAA